MAIVFHLFLINMFFFFVYFRHSEESSAPRITKISQKSLQRYTGCFWYSKGSRALTFENRVRPLKSWTTIG